MRIGIVGSGVVGQTLGTALARAGEDVVLGTRSPDNLAEKRGMGGTLQDWVATTGGRGRVDTFAAAAAHGEIVIHATSGTGALEALRIAGADNLDGKILIDVSNPLDFSRGMPPSLTVSNTDSLAEQIQRALPATHVVKTLNTVTAALMVDPGLVGGGDHHLFVSGNDGPSKERVIELLGRWFGWREVIDLGDITTARGTEMYLPLWVRLWGAMGTHLFNVRIVK